MQAVSATGGEKLRRLILVGIIVAFVVGGVAWALAAHHGSSGPSVGDVGKNIGDITKHVSDATKCVKGSPKQIQKCLEKQVPPDKATKCLTGTPSQIAKCLRKQLPIPGG
jgi:hypothetical protein